MCAYCLCLKFMQMASFLFLCVRLVVLWASLAWVFLLGGRFTMPPGGEQEHEQEQGRRIGPKGKEEE